MKTLTAEKAKELIERLVVEGDDLSIREAYYLQAMQIAYNVLKTSAVDDDMDTE